VERLVRDRELLVGVEGLALLRWLYDGSAEVAERRLAAVRRILDDEATMQGVSTWEADARAGYREWSRSYDEPGNPIIGLEQPVVWSLLERAPAGRALDAACGTGRHAARLVALGHEVLGFDVTREMLERARAHAPGARFVEGDLRAIPAPDDHFDLVVCGLAVAHLPSLSEPVSEMARVLRPGGRLVISTLHPILAHLGWQAPFGDPEGARGFVREHAHTHADYLEAFRTAALEVVDCHEPRLTADHVRAKRRVYEHDAEAATQAYSGLPGVLVWSALKPRG
jgi:SAM-dependent methyltransferase